MNKYKAFISYSHKDEKFATWLHKSLEKYKVPNALQKSYPNLPNKLYPIFKDREELPSSSNLSQNIIEALKESDYLIVICSINSAKSQWVNKEIVDFKRIHGEDRILAIIIDGEPNAKDKEDIDDTLECFPEALKYKVNNNGNVSNTRTEPIAADVRDGKDGYKFGKLKIIAGLLKIGFEELYKREEKRQKKSHLIWFSFSVFIISIVSFLALYAFFQKKVAEEKNYESKKLAYTVINRQGLIYKNYLNEPLKAKHNFANAIAQSVNKPQENKSKLLYNSIDNTIKLKSFVNYNTKGLIFNKSNTKFLSLETNKVVLFNTLTNEKKYITEHNTSVSNVLFSNDETEILSWDKQTIKISNEQNNTIKTLVYKYDIQKVFFSKNKKYIVSLGEERSNIWDRDKNTFFNLEQNISIKGIDFSIDGQYMVSWDYNVVKIWNLFSKKVIKIFKDEDGILGEVIFDKYNNIIINRYYDENNLSIKSYNITSKKKNFEIKGYFLGFTKDKRNFITVEDRDSSIFQIKNVKTGLKINSLQHTYDHLSKYISSKNYILLVSNSIFNVNGGEVQLKYLDYEYEITKIEYESYVRGSILSSNEKYMISWSPNKIIVFDIENNKLLPPLLHDQPIIGVVFNEKNNQIISWDNNDIKYWKIQNTRKKVFDLNEYETKEYHDTIYTKNGKYLLSWHNGGYNLPDNKKEEELQKKLNGYYDNTLRLTNINQDTTLNAVKHKALINKAILSSNEYQVLTCSEDNTSKLFDIKTKKVLYTLKHNNIINVKFSKDGKYILSYSPNGLIKLWNRKNGKSIFKLQDNSNAKIGFFYRTFGANISEDSKQILSFSGQNIIIWNIKDLKVVFNLKRSNAVLKQIYNKWKQYQIQGASLSKNKEKIVFWYNTGVLNSKYMLCVWDIKNNKELMSYKLKTINNAIFTKDMKKVLCWGEYEGLLFDINSGEKLVKFKKDLNYIPENLKFKFDKNEKILFSKHNNILNIWDTKTGELLFEIEDKREVIWNNTDSFLSKLYNSTLAKKNYPLKTQLETGTYLSSSGELKTLPVKEWLEKKKLYESKLKE